MLFAKADLLLLQNNLQQAAIEFKTLSDNSNLFIINEFSKIKLVEIFICTNEYQEAINLLIDITINQKNAVFIEKAAFLLAKIYHYGLGDLVRASEIYQKILENFPNSLYFDRARDALNGISLKTDKNE
jgi:tetratricopeptide (TPR) repeat protein